VLSAQGGEAAIGQLLDLLPAGLGDGILPGGDGDLSGGTWTP
jgi:hypothetical protein